MTNAFNGLTDKILSRRTIQYSITMLLHTECPNTLNWSSNDFITSDNSWAVVNIIYWIENNLSTEITLGDRLNGKVPIAGCVIVRVSMTWNVQSWSYTTPNVLTETWCHYNTHTIPNHDPEVIRLTLTLPGPSAGVSGFLDSYCSLKPLCSDMGEVVPARTSPTLLPHPLALCCHYPVSKYGSASIVATGDLRVKCHSGQTRRRIVPLVLPDTDIVPIRKISCCNLIRKQSVSLAIK